MKRLFVALSFFALHGVGAQAPGPGAAGPAAGVARSSPESPRPSPGTELTIYLMTMGHGDEVWERFGHNAIRIVDAARGTDSVYNWGTFDFHQPNFLRRFMTGNTLYWMASDGLAEELEKYRYLNRSVWEQELDLTPQERQAVRDFIAWNARPENLYYRYDYYLDNCSTRVRDIMDRIVGGQLRAATESRLTTTTYRFHTQRLLQFDRAVAAGTNIGLGEVADRPLSAWKEMFLPTRMQEHVRSVRLKNPDGSTRPLVKSEKQLFAAQRAPEPAQPPDMKLLYLAVGVTIGVTVVLLTRAASTGHRWARAAVVTLGTTWAALGGILGILLIVGWVATRHTFMAWNENLLQFNPISLALAVVFPLSALRGRAVRAAERLALAVAVIALVGFVMQALPRVDQVNGDVIALTLPVHLALAWAVRVLAATYEASPVPPGAAARAMVSRSAA